jgi:hypothetical protein
MLQVADRYGRLITYEVRADTTIAWSFSGMSGVLPAGSDQSDVLAAAEAHAPSGGPP